MINVISCTKKSWLILIYQACTFCHNYVVFFFFLILPNKISKKYIYKVDVNIILLDQYKLLFDILLCFSLDNCSHTCWTRNRQSKHRIRLSVYSNSH